MAGIAAGLAWLWCKDGCSNQRVAAAFTYFPPDPFYQIRKGDADALNIEIHQPFKPYSYTHDLVTFVETRTGNKLAVVAFRRESAKSTILYSHGNATDLGAMYDRYADISSALGVNVVAYDYSGYGCSSGSPTEMTTYDDITAVYEWTKQRFPESSIILYGQSLGSGPSCFLASRQAVAGLILHSPIMSGLRVLTPNRLLGCCDVYPNVEFVSRASCPVFVIHGRDDQEVTMEHGRGLHERVPFEHKYEPWFVDGKGHNDVVESDTVDEYFARLRAFLKQATEDS